MERGSSPFEVARDQLRPRLIQTHLPIQLLPDQIWSVNPKIIYVFRNLKDVVVSYFHHFTTLHGYLGEIKEFVDCFVNDTLLWSPYHEHISGFVELSEIKDNILLTKYEDMKKDLPKEIQRTAKFLNLQFNEQEVLRLADHLSIDSMRSLYHKII